MTMVEPGMTRRQVRHLLGSPTNSVNDRQFLGRYATRSFLDLRVWRRRSRSEAWVYANTPDAGLATFIHFTRGRVEKVLVTPVPGRGEPADGAA
ncbi:outer membrane protein assembly factor BamE domain-containing protein [Streptomyces olindensis]|uniref:outer membrane protein assembly factor BamE domain-containing protein n=1 Tax=Streptomyces olindensis TaxID=358823 RepID=UPI0033F5AEE9